jgi:hypothetical protein
VITRRRLLQRVLVLLGLGPAGVTTPLRAHTAEVASTAGPLSAAQIDDLVTFGEVLVDGRALSAAERGFLREHIEDRMQRTPAYVDVYRTTVTTLERLAGRPFARLEPAERIALVARHRLGSSQLSEDEVSGRYPEDVRTIRKQAVEDLVGGYYNSAAGWAVVGYQTFPGRCGDLTRYTRPEP